MARLIFLAAAFLAAAAASAQNIGINVTGAAPDPSALLDVDAAGMTGTKRGILVPRMTATEMNAIPAPATSLLVFNTTAGTFFYFDGVAWVSVGSKSGWNLTGNAGASPSINFLGTTDNQDLVFRTNNLERVRITTGPRFLFNTLGTNPVDALLISSPIFDIACQGDANNFRIRSYGIADNSTVLSLEKAGGSILTPSTTSTNDILGRYGFSAFDGTKFQMVAAIMGQLDGPIGPGAYEGRIDLCTSLGGNFPDPKLSVLGSGNVGIGTITPLERLHVVGSIRMDDGNQAVGFVPVSDANGTMAWTDPATVVGNVGWSLTGNAGTVPGTNFIGTTDNNALEIRTNNFTRMSFNTIGNVGIGTTTPGRHAEISGTGDQFLRITSTNTQACGIEFKRTSSGSDWQERNQSGLLLFGQSNDDLATVADVLRLGGGSVTPAVDNTITCGQSTLRWTNIFATSGVVNTSDARDKTNIRPLDRGLAELMRLKPVRYQWKDRPEEGDKLGLIAQDLQQVLPETVFSKEWTTREDGTREQVPAQRLGVYYSDLIPVLIKAIQEQQHLIEDLQARIHTLETRH